MILTSHAEVEERTAIFGVILFDPASDSIRGKARTCDYNYRGEKAQDKDQEGVVVVNAHAIVNPRTVMIIPLDTSAANRAVLGPRRDHDFAVCA